MILVVLVLWFLLHLLCRDLLHCVQWSLFSGNHVAHCLCLGTCVHIRALWITSFSLSVSAARVFQMSWQCTGSFCCSACCAEMASLRTVTVLRLPRGTLIVMGALRWYSSHRLLRYLRAHPCGLDSVLFPLCLCGRLSLMRRCFFRCLGSVWCSPCEILVQGLGPMKCSDTYSWCRVRSRQRRKLSGVAVVSADR